MYIKASDIRKAKRARKTRLCKSEHDKFLSATGLVQNDNFKPVFLKDDTQIKKDIHRIIHNNLNLLQTHRDFRIGITISTPQLGAFRQTDLTELKDELSDLCTLINNIHVHDNRKPQVHFNLQSVYYNKR